MKPMYILATGDQRNRPPALLVLEDGTCFEGRVFGRLGEVCAEVVFNTAMTGYQEILTDPSYRGQMVCMTYPLIGNYGVNPEDVETVAERPWVEGFIIRELTPITSSWRATTSLSEYMDRAGVVGIDEVDTRALVLHLRTHGALRGCLSSLDLKPDSLRQKALAHPIMEGRDLTAEVTRPAKIEYAPSPTERTAPLTVHHVVAVDYGMKENIIRLLRAENFRVTVVPSQTGAKEILDLHPDGVFLSNGPGDPAAVTGGIETARTLVCEHRVPTFGICLGHQLLGLALGGKTFKLKFGHHGANHPVQVVATRAVEITSQNHNFAVDPDSLDKSAVEITHWNLNDNSVEGLRHRELPVYAVQFHPEAAPGPHDSQGLFAQFRSLIEGKGKAGGD
jgi:carbamoyl-phosphate synthase small subunit